MIEYSIVDERFSKAMVEFILTQDNLGTSVDFNGKVVINSRGYSYRIGYNSAKVSIYGKVPKEAMQIIDKYCTPIPVPAPAKMISFDPARPVESITHHIPVLSEDETEYLRGVLLRHKPHESDRFRHDDAKLSLQEIAEAWEN